ncbi:hypothetical protein BM536_007710, partial [Streptomyces phaeoluteigriseus]
MAGQSQQSDGRRGGGSQGQRHAGRTVAEAVVHDGDTDHGRDDRVDQGHGHQRHRETGIAVRRLRRGQSRPGHDRRQAQAHRLRADGRHRPAVHDHLDVDRRHAERHTGRRASTAARPAGRRTPAAAPASRAATPMPPAAISDWSRTASGTAGPVSTSTVSRAGAG